MLSGILVALSPAVSAVTASNVKCKGCINGQEIKTNAVQGKHVRKKAVTGGKLAPDAVTNSRIRDHAVSASKLSSKAVAAIATRNEVHNVVRITRDERATGGASTDGSVIMVAVNAINDADANNRYLIDIGPGTWDMGSSVLRMKSFVDIAGAGEGVTRIKGSLGSGGVIEGASDSELRYLTVENTAGDSNTNDQALASAILNEDVAATISNVTAIVSGEHAAGIHNADADRTRLQRVTVIASNPAGIRGIVNTDSAVTISQVAVDVAGEFAIGIQNTNASVLVDSGHVSAVGLGAKGFHSFDSKLEISNLKIDVDGATPHCMENRASDVHVINVQGIARSPGARCVTTNLRGTTRIYNSVISGVVFSLVTDDDGSRAYVANSQLIGAPWFLGTEFCINTIDESFQLLGSDCNSQ